MDYRLLGNSASNGFRISFPKLAIVTLSLPLLAFAFCIVWSLVYNFNSSTSTHCGVNNYLPSISAAIGMLTPQKHVWRFAIALHTSPRYLVAVMYYHLKHNSVFLFMLNIIEITALFGLTFISSTENYRMICFAIHAKFFGTFMFSALLNMFLVSYGETLYRPLRTSKVKKLLSLTNITAGALAAYFFMRHNWYCEAGMYTLFALCEYIVVITNMAFHFQSYFDFKDINFSIASNKVDENIP